MNVTGDRRRGVLAAFGSLLAAAVASACCWLPLTLLAMGASAGGVSAALEPWRPLMLALAAALLTAGFYFVYWRKAHCAPGSACATPGRGLQRFNEVMLWVAALGVVAFAFFPKYVRLFMDPGPEAISSTSTETTTVSLAVEGMTCEACAVHIERELRLVPGVVRASVDYERSEATVALDAAATASSDEQLLDAVVRAGYTVGTVTRQ